MELYDLSLDPGEQSNLSSQYPQIVADRKADLTAWQARQVLYPVERLTVTPLSKSIKLTWVHPTGGEKGYRIEQSLDGVRWTQVRQVTGTSTITTTFTGLTPGVTYQYRMRAYNDIGGSAGQSGYSGVVSTQPLA